MTRRTHRTVARLVGACVALACACGATGCTMAPDPLPSQLVAEELDTIFDAVRNEESIRAILVWQRGQPVYEDYLDATADDTWDIRGVTAAITSTLIGMAIDQGLISGVDATLGELLPSYASALTAETSGITLHAVLTHTANFTTGPEVPHVHDPDWVASTLIGRGIRGPGDDAFRFSAMGVHVLAAVVTEATGMRPLDYARETLFDPLGIDSSNAWEEPFPVDTRGSLEYVPDGYEEAGFAWPTDPAGIHLGADMLRVRPDDLRRFGEMLLDEGVWESDAVISKSWVAQATWPIVETGDATMPHWGYGFGVNDEAGVFFSEGLGGTVVMAHPEKDAVIVIASEIPPDDDGTQTGVVNVSARALAFAVMERLPLD